MAVFSSPINRALSTAQYLFGAERQMTLSPEFREFERSLGRRALKTRLPIKLWTAVARVKWMLGLSSKDIESYARAKQRARKAANMLAEASKENSKVVLVAHGFLNRYIADDLEKMGWRVVRDGGHGYLSTTILVKMEDSLPPDAGQLALEAK